MDIEEVLREETVKRIGYDETLEVAPQTPIREVIGEMRRQQAGAALVCDSGRLVGLFTERDLLRFLTTDQADLSVPVSDRMTRDPVCVGQEESVASAICRMQEGGFRRLPVVDKDRVACGMLSVKQIVRFIADHFPAAIFNIPPQPGRFASECEGA